MEVFCTENTRSPYGALTGKPRKRDEKGEDSTSAGKTNERPEG